MFVFSVHLCVLFHKPKVGRHDVLQPLAGTAPDLQLGAVGVRGELVGC